MITPYRAQVKQIRDFVIKEVAMGQKVEINTVDQYQGRDKNIIIYCCVRSGVAESDVSVQYLCTFCDIHHFICTPRWS